MKRKVPESDVIVQQIEGHFPEKFHTLYIQFQMN